MAHNEKAEELTYVEVFADEGSAWLTAIKEDMDRWITQSLGVSPEALGYPAAKPHVNLPTSHLEPYASQFYGTQGFEPIKP